MGCPIVGDTMYGGPRNNQDMLLHAHNIVFVGANNCHYNVTVPVPSTWKEFGAL